MTASNPVFLINEEVAFSKRLVRRNDISYEIDPNQLLTKWGMVIPMNVDSVDFFDFLEGHVDEMQLWDRSARVLLINHQGLVHEILVAGARAMSSGDEVVVSRMRVLTGPETRYSRAHEGDQEYKASVALSAGKPLRETVSLYKERFNMHSSDYVFVSIAAIAARLTELGYTEPFPKYPRHEADPKA